MNIRLGEIKDLNSIMPLFKELDNKHIRNSKDVREEISNNRYKSIFKAIFERNSNWVLTVTEIDSKVIGFAIGKTSTIKNHLIFKDAIIGEIIYVAIDKTYKRQGIGVQIMEDIERRLKSNGADKFELRVFNFNDETLPEKIKYKVKYVVYEKY